MCYELNGKSFPISLSPWSGANQSIELTDKEYEALGEDQNFNYFKMRKFIKVSQTSVDGKKKEPVKEPDKKEQEKKEPDKKQDKKEKE